MRLNIETQRTVAAAIAASETTTDALRRVLDAAKAEELRESKLLTNKMRIAGWLGPHGYLLQSYEKKRGECCCCGKSIDSWEQHASWTLPHPPEVSLENLEKWRRYAHPECMRRIGLALTSLAAGRGSQVLEKPHWATKEEHFYKCQQATRGAAAALLGMKYPAGLRYIADMVPAWVRAVPAWSRF